jgi:hypothetical protein
MQGFYISKISVQGENLPPAEIEFHSGTNVITGASDSGKTFIFESLNYVLGASRPPKEINESKGYKNFIIEIVSFNDEKVYTIHRPKDSTVAFVKEVGINDYWTSQEEAKPYKTNSNKEDDSLSNFLLSFSGLEGKSLLKNKVVNKKQKLSYKNILKFTFVSEQKIIKDESPFYASEQVIFQTLDQSLLKIFLTGNDFSNFKEKESKKDKESKISGKLEFIDNQLEKYTIEREVAEKKLKKIEEDNALNITINKLKKELEDAVVSSKDLATQRRNLLEETEKLRRRLDYTEQLIYKFSILEKQYVSDQKRLAFILEGESMLTQLEDSFCPVCTSPLDQDHVNHINENEGFKDAAIEELNRITLKLADLEDTSKSLNSQKQNLVSLIQKKLKESDTITQRLNEVIFPKVEGLKTDINQYLLIESRILKIKFIDDEVSKLYKEKHRLNDILSDKEAEENFSLIGYSLLNEYCKYIEKRLQNWNYEPTVKVAFNSHYKVFDIVISGKSRRSFGKGKRAISYSACLLGLLDYCKKENKPFTNLIVLDSPLTTYEEKKRKKTNEKLNNSIKNSFFKDIAEINSNCQIIIFDNKEPEEELQDKINLIVFTGDEETGRAGFFPYTDTE